MLTVVDSLSAYGIENAAIRKGDNEFADFETPFVCAIQQPDWAQPYFTVVSAVAENEISYLDPIKKVVRSIPVEDFNKMDKDIVLLLDTDQATHEPDFEKNRSQESRDRWMRFVPIIFFIIAVISAVGYAFWSSPPSFAGVGTTLVLLNSVGLLVSSLLVWHDIDAHNPFLKEVCGSRSGKLNCDAVLKSNGAFIFGISWSVLGFSYFATMLLSQLLFGLSSELYLPYWLFLSLCIIPYTFYSVYYQWKIVKQWCPLCLAVQGVILLSGLLAGGYLSVYGFSITSLYPIFTLLFIGVFVLMVSHHVVPLLKAAKESREYETKWKRLRYNPEIFDALLQKETFIAHPTEGLGLQIGNPDATHEIIKVCNPYCGPCSKAHPDIEELIHSNPNVKVRIIFTASGHDDDIKTPPVKHLLAIQERHGAATVHQALDDWYLAEKKDYTAFANKYPLNGELEQQGVKIEAMSKWCDMMKIRATPTFFVNGYELPDSYRIGELKHIL